MDTVVTTVAHTLSPLEELKAHFDKTGRRQIKCDLVSVSLYCEPLNAEDYLFVQDAQKLEPKKRIRQLALLIVAKVKGEDGAPAFRHQKGAKAAAEELATSIPPLTFFDLFGSVFDETTSARVEELGNDSGTSGSAG